MITRKNMVRKSVKFKCVPVMFIGRTRLMNWYQLCSHAYSERDGSGIELFVEQWIANTTSTHRQKEKSHVKMTIHSSRSNRTPKESIILKHCSGPSVTFAYSAQGGGGAAQPIMPKL